MTGFPSNSPWTPERVEKLRQMRGDGFSFGLIAAKLGLSRNTVVGKANRLGMLEKRRETRENSQPDQTINRWSSEQDELLKQFRADGLSYSEIGMRLGKTKVAVISRARKIGLRTASRGRPKRSRIAADADHKLRMKLLRKASAPPAFRVVHPKPAPEPPPPENLVPFDELTPNSCRWPFGHPREAGFGYCGAPKRLGSSYCNEHHRLSCGAGTLSERRAVEAVA